jgi:hypothetical protein
MIHNPWLLVISCHSSLQKGNPDARNGKIGCRSIFMNSKDLRKSRKNETSSRDGEVYSSDEISTRNTASASLKHYLSTQRIYSEWTSRLDWDRRSGGPLGSSLLRFRCAHLQTRKFSIAYRLNSEKHRPPTQPPKRSVGRKRRPKLFRSARYYVRPS